MVIQSKLIPQSKVTLICAFIIAVVVVILYVHYFAHYSYCIVSTNMQNKYGATTLSVASQEGHIKCATVLLKHGANVNYQRKVRLLYVE